MMMTRVVGAIKCCLNQPSLVVYNVSSRTQTLCRFCNWQNGSIKYAQALDGRSVGCPCAYVCLCIVTPTAGQHGLLDVVVEPDGKEVEDIYQR